MADQRSRVIIYIINVRANPENTQIENRAAVRQRIRQHIAARTGGSGHGHQQRINASALQRLLTENLAVAPHMQSNTSNESASNESASNAANSSNDSLHHTVHQLLLEDMAATRQAAEEASRGQQEIATAEQHTTATHPKNTAATSKSAPMPTASAKSQTNVLAPSNDPPEPPPPAIATGETANTNGPEICGVCREPFTGPISVWGPCRHLFCFYCARQWYLACTSRPYTSCPLCRGPDFRYGPVTFARTPRLGWEQATENIDRHEMGATEPALSSYVLNEEDDAEVALWDNNIIEEVAVVTRYMTQLPVDCRLYNIIHFDPLVDFIRQNFDIRIRIEMVEMTNVEGQGRREIVNFPSGRAFMSAVGNYYGYTISQMMERFQ